jgi:hypothetical protein
MAISESILGFVLRFLVVTDVFTAHAWVPLSQE